MDLLFIFSCGRIAERLFLLLFCELTTLHKKHQRAAMDSLRSALSIVPSGTAATIIVGHALLTKVMICVETKTTVRWVILRIIAETSPSSCRSYGDNVASMA